MSKLLPVAIAGASMSIKIKTAVVICSVMILSAVAVGVTTTPVLAAGSCGDYCVNACKSRLGMGAAHSECLRQCGQKCEQQKAGKSSKQKK